MFFYFIFGNRRDRVLKIFTATRTFCVAELLIIHSNCPPYIVDCPKLSWPRGFTASVTTPTRGYLCRRQASTPRRYLTQPIRGCALTLGTTWSARIIFTRFSARRIPGTSTAKAITTADKRKGLSRARDDPRPWARCRKLARENIAFNWENRKRQRRTPSTAVNYVEDVEEIIICCAELRYGIVTVRSQTCRSSGADGKRTVDAC